MAQSPTYPSVPAPQPVDTNTFPSMGVPTKAAKPENVGTPAQAPTQNPAQAPSPVPGTPVSQQTPTNPAIGQSPTVQDTPDPLETPIKVQPAQPGQPTPVDIAPPVPVTSLPSIAVDYPSPTPQEMHDHLGSTYITDDDVIYPMALRLYSLGYLDTAFISMRPWTRRSLLHALEQSAPAIQSDNDEQAMEIYAKLLSLLSDEIPGSSGTLTDAMTRGKVYGVESVYTRLMGISGLTLRDSYHLGQTIVNDYGRPYEAGFNNLTGFSSVNEWGRFSLYVRGEYQHSPSAAGYDYNLSSYLSSVLDQVPFAPPNLQQATIPYGPLSAVNPFRLQEAALSFHWAKHEFSVGKTDAWLGPAAGGSMAWSNNAEDIYSFRINRVENLNIPYFSYLFGGLRYDFFVGSLKGHTAPNDPWVHSEMFSLRPTDNFEFTFQRTVIWGGEGHVPVTFGTFFRSFFSTQDTQANPLSKNSSSDPGARYSDFSFSWRLPYLRKYVTLYTDSIAHDDVTPISAPRRAAYRPGIYLSQVPGLRKLDFRAEASSTDTSTLRSLGGQFNYFETVQKQGYTNKGFIMGDWIGREAKGGNAWLTYHLSANEWVQLEYLNKKTPKDFIAGGTTQNQFKIDVVKRLRPDVELDAWYQFEKWKAPIYVTGAQNDSVFTVQVKFFPKLRTQPDVQTGLNGKTLTAQPGGGTR
ncbi:MAG: capsule assembly Wzi family protein [Janthinobacterium lividum]